VVHADTDHRAPLEESVFFHVVMRRHGTCEIVQINFKIMTAAARTWPCWQPLA
jgi:hypothetical protein